MLCWRNSKLNFAVIASTYIYKLKCSTWRHKTVKPKRTSEMKEQRLWETSVQSIMTEPLLARGLDAATPTHVSCWSQIFVWKQRQKKNHPRDTWCGEERHGRTGFCWNLNLWVEGDVCTDGWRQESSEKKLQKTQDQQKKFTNCKKKQHKLILNVTSVSLLSAPGGNWKIHHVCSSTSAGNKQQLLH